MKRFLKIRSSHIALCLATLPAVTLAQTIPPIEQCAPATGTTSVPAPGSGSITVGNLTKYGLPAQVCTKISLAGSRINFDYTGTLATTYNNAKFPSSCAGIEYTLNGGPAYSAVTGTGNFALGTTVTGTLNATALSITENLTLTAGGNSFVINTGLLNFRTFMTLNADQSVDIRICTPKGGIPATVNGSNFSIPSNIWQCLAAPPDTQQKVRTTYDENC